jgi:hypothetical protein
VQSFRVNEIKNDLNGTHNWIEKATQGDYIG